MIAADVMYDERLGRYGVGGRIAQLLERPDPPKILVTDSQRFSGTDFVPDLNKQFQTSFSWQERKLENFTGSGVMIDEDQTYQVTARLLLSGWEDDK